MENRLFYNKSAQNWNEALPLGNGFMGAMCFGGTIVDRFQLNNDSLWYGGKRDRINPDAKKYLPEIRRLIFAGKIVDAEELANEAVAAIPDYQSRYEPLGDVFLIPEGKKRVNFFGLRDGWNSGLYDMAECSDYSRSLSLTNGMHKTEYTVDGERVFRESFISYPHKVMVIRSEGARLRVIAERGLYCGEMKRVDEKTLVLSGKAGADGVEYCLCIRASKGNLGIIGRTLHLDKSSVLLISSDTSFYHDDPLGYALKCLDDAEKFEYECLYYEHISDFSGLMNRCTLEIDNNDSEQIPTDERLKRLRDGGDETMLTNLAFAYGRYLLVSSSRSGSLPANLQGIWNAEFLPAWDSKYTININTEMNYWHAETTNLSELHMPLFDHIKRMLPSGRECAEKMYGARGFMAHHNTDIWGDCAPQDIWPPSTYWQMGAAWLCLHVFEHYRFTGDKSFLEEYLPIVKEAALFFENTLVENTAGELVVCPTTSPENTYRLPSGETGNLCHGASIDSQILFELFSGLLETEMLSEEEKAHYEAILARLPKPKIEENGTLQEWAEPYEEIEIGHRHISHLFAVYPGTEINTNNTELMNAAIKTLERRLSGGGGHTGWSRAWIINEWARMRRGDNAAEDIRKYFEDSVLPNLFCNHPPFQIDGNFGVSAGIAECLLQSHDGRISLLPALPSKWKSGKVTGLRARGGITVDMEWSDGILTCATLTADNDCECVLESGERVLLKKGVRTCL